MTNEYIKCPEWSKTYYTFQKNTEIFQPKDKVPIKKIKFDKSYLAFPNPIYETTVQNIISEFYLGAWEPIWINKNYFLLDGQHRLEAAKRMDLKYIDVIIEDTELLNKS